MFRIQMCGNPATVAAPAAAPVNTLLLLILISPLLVLSVGACRAVDAPLGLPQTRSPRFPAGSFLHHHSRPFRPFAGKKTKKPPARFAA
jgi:hypothetical protein